MATIPRPSLDAKMFLEEMRPSRPPLGLQLCTTPGHDSSLVAHVPGKDHLGDVAKSLKAIMNHFYNVDQAEIVSHP